MTGLAGEVTSREAWKMLRADDGALLVDVRTTAEWAFVGRCDLSPVGRQPIHLSWQVFPDMTVNGEFCQALTDAGIDKDTTLLFMCRSGARSRAAASAMAGRGFRRCFNISDGFEGDPDEQHHRGTISGWKASGLPWVQQ